MRILLVEEDEAVREAFKDILEHFGYEVWDTKHGLEALALARGEPAHVDLAISDVMTRHLNALELYEALQKLQDDVKMLVVTNYPTPQSAQSLVERPGVSWTRRPISMEQLGKEVSMMVGDNGSN